MFEGLLQPMHLLVIFMIGLFVFGPKKLPDLGTGLAEGIRGFRDTLKSDSAGPNFFGSPTDFEKRPALTSPPRSRRLKPGCKGYAGLEPGNPGVVEFVPINWTVRNWRPKASGIDRLARCQKSEGTKELAAKGSSSCF